MVRVLVVLLLLTGTAQAGPWTREMKEGFLSFSTIAKKAEKLTDPLSYSSIYVEYGLRPNLTIGFDGGADDLGQYKALIFAARSIRGADRKTRMTLELGLGAVNDKFVLRPGLAIGRSFTALSKPGWFSVETRAEMTPELSNIQLGTDITLGLSPWDRTKLIFQVQSGGTMADPDYIRLAPSVTYEVKPGRHLELGMTAGIKNAESFGVKFGMWRSF